MNTAQEFWSCVAKGRKNECWPWCGPLFRTGYGQTYWYGYPRIASRVAAYLSGLVHAVAAPKRRTAFGFVLHTCDFPPCCNPRHLFVGTARDNAQDSIRKDRYHSNFYSMPGASNGRAKLTPKQVATIRRRYAKGVTQIQLAIEYGVVQPHISRLVRLEQYL